MYNTLIFDLDGTLVDSIEDLALSTNILMEESQFPTYDLETYKQFVGNGVDKLIERALPEEHKKEVRKYRARFDEIYKENCLKNTKPYPGMEELIDELYHQGYKLAVVTNKPKINAVTIVNHLFPGKFMYVFGNTVYQPKTTSLFSTTSYAVNGK
ncbi:MAG: HAD family hydrolase [Faecalibacillus faecis]